MTARGRLRSVQQGLTAQERVRAILAAHRSQRAPDPRLRATLPQDQEREFRRLTTMTTACARQAQAMALLYARTARELHLLHTCVTLMAITEIRIQPALAYFAGQPAPPGDDAGFDADRSGRGTLGVLTSLGSMTPPGVDEQR